MNHEYNLQFLRQNSVFFSLHLHKLPPASLVTTRQALSWHTTAIYCHQVEWQHHLKLVSELVSALS